MAITVTKQEVFAWMTMTGRGHAEAAKHFLPDGSKEERRKLAQKIAIWLHRDRKKVGATAPEQPQKGAHLVVLPRPPAATPPTPPNAEEQVPAPGGPVAVPEDLRGKAELAVRRRLDRLASNDLNREKPIDSARIVLAMLRGIDIFKDLDKGKAPLPASEQVAEMTDAQVEAAARLALEQQG